MADELNIPTHRWYQPRNNIKLPSNLVSKKWILSSGVALIDAWINSQPWGVQNPIPGLFALGEPGVWYDPSDLTTLFQDAAGTTPVTTPAQPVGLVLDKSQGLVLGPELVTNGTFDTNTTGWEAVAGTIAAVSGRLRVSYGTPNPFARQGVSCVIGQTYLLTGKYFGVSETTRIYVGDSNTGANPQGIVDFTGDGSATVRFRATAATMWIIASGRSLTTGEFVEFDNISVKLLPGNHATQSTAASRPTYGVVPKGGRRNLLLATDTMATQSATVTAAAHTLSFTGTGTVTLTGASIAGPLIGTGAGNRVSLTFTPTAGSLTMTVLGSVTLAQLELGSTATAYQRVVSQYDVTEAGVQSLSYLSFDGVDDFLVTNTITPGIDKAQVFAGVRKLTDAVAGILLESSSNAGANNGALYVVTGPDPLAANRYSGATRGSASFSGNNTATTNLGNAPDQAVLSLTHDIAGDLTTIRRNGVAGTSSTVDLETGNFLAYPLYIGRRNGTSAPFNGHIYSLITRFGANLSAEQITSTETWVNTKTGAYV